MDRRSFMRTIAAGFVALAVVVAPAIADELFGVITKVDTSAKKLTVVEKGTDKEIEVTTTDDTEVATKKGTNKIDLERISKQVTKSIDAGRKGMNVKITHDKGVASKIEPIFARKKADN